MMYNVSGDNLNLDFIECVSVSWIFEYIDF